MKHTLITGNEDYLDDASSEIEEIYVHRELGERVTLMNAGIAKRAITSHTEYIDERLVSRK